MERNINSCNKNKQKFSRKRKIKFRGNRYTKKQNVSPEPSTPPSLRSRKVTQGEPSKSAIDDDDYFLLINFKILKTFMQNYLCCPQCEESTINFTIDNSSRMGFANKMVLSCASCDWDSIFFTSNQTTKPSKKQGRNMFEINVRSVVAFREIGKGHESIKAKKT